MPDWTKSMQQTFEFYEVNPATWKDVKRLDNVVSCDINRDIGAETLGSATFDMDGSLGECYIRAYLVTIQNGLTEKHPLGTFLIQTPASSFDGKVRKVSMDAYTPLLELKESPPTLGYYIPKGENIMDMAYRLARENSRPPVISAVSDKTLNYNFVADLSDTWLSYLSALVRNAKYRFDLDESGRILFAPLQDTESLQPVWTYNDDNSSILLPNVSMEHDLYKIPNVVEAVYTKATDHIYVRIVNDDPNSPISTVNRGREIVYREVDPDITGTVVESRLKEYAENLLKEMSTLEYSVTYSHAYCPVKIGDCVRLNYSRAGINNIKARVTNQSIKCTPGCTVSETAVFTTKLWR